MISEINIGTWEINPLASAEAIAAALHWDSHLEFEMGESLSEVHRQQITMLQLALLSAVKNQLVDQEDSEQ